MYTLLITTFLYPYPYQYETWILAFLILLAIGLPTYGIYRLIIWKMNESVKTGFHRILVLAGMIIIGLFFAEGKAMDKAHIPILRDKKKIMISVWVPEMDIPLSFSSSWVPVQNR